MNKRQQGAEAEKAVANLYAKAGYSIVQTNYHSGRYGEIDIIAQKNFTVVFIEVKCRKKGSLSSPAEAVNQRKQSRIRTVASSFISNDSFAGFDYSDYNVRFDVAEVTEEEKKYIINIIKNAF